ncbi:hypothetical protein [Nocardioides sp. B-3]|uniref:hypothetical protein n=1 Tax=Nocardioides sp. B-3 TaxID=2895565 RepID=UPI0021539395|nr:hypothetical protein [Nocardioides sp. B-3]UUZ59074.1 hypothetical protein LP418_24445 [Nocardioides sp. B-3]
MPSLGGSSYSRTAGLDRPDHVGGRLEARHLGVCFRLGRQPFGLEVEERAGLHAFLAEAGQHVADVVEIGLVRADEEHAATAIAESWIGVEEVGRAVECDHCLTRAGAAVDDEGAA